MARRAPEGAFDFDALVPGEGARELEVGFGRGRFLLERALAAPGSRVLGIEIKAKWGHLVEERRRREGLTNVVALAGDAREILPRLGPEACLTRVFLHFPDPWWKKKHAKRRVLDPDFLEQVRRLLAPGGEFFVQTDVEDRALDMRAQIEACVHEGAPVFAVREGFDGPNPYGARSNREVRAEEDQLPVYRVLAIRR
jgi:tRNA (guanine-N7-)-methyltransferase